MRWTADGDAAVCWRQREKWPVGAPPQQGLPQVLKRTLSMRHVMLVNCLHQGRDTCKTPVLLLLVIIITTLKPSIVTNRNRQQGERIQLILITAIIVTITTIITAWQFCVVVYYSLFLVLTSEEEQRMNGSMCFLWQTKQTQGFDPLLTVVTAYGIMHLHKMTTRGSNWVF